MDKCIFCQIASHHIPADVISESDDVMAFADINPATKGHILVIPKSHTTNLFDIDEALFIKVLQLAKRIVRIMPEALGCSGVNLFHSAGESAWQEVMHFHLHIVPRYNKEELRRPFVSTPANKAELKEIASALSQKLGNK
ncbi:MAG: HIT domain-containing protein [Candidatus Omnitrophica bacterium]|nr:HIT domain-containing protein [Candidatus Omnitrophota bacterium]